MSEIKRVKIGSILESQIPEFLSVESPLLVEFLEQYYKSMESQSGSIDIISNITKYKNTKKFNNIDLIEETSLTSDVLSFDTSINVTSTKGWPDTYGLLKINNEIITYTSKTETSFNNCIRGFSGIENLRALDNPEFAVFTSTNTEEHLSGAVVSNLSNLFLVEFFEKFKYEFLPGFESRDFYENISVENIAYKIKDLYSSKGTDQSYKLLFKILYGSDIEIIKPQDYTLTPSSNSYFITKNILVEKISGGDPIDTKGNFLFQNIAGIGTVSASIFNVEYRPVANKNFYEISLDSTSFSGNFEVSGKTRILESVSQNDDNILVDSTVGFANSGSIIVKPRNSDYITINYTGKNINQFTGVTNVSKPLDFGLDLTEEKFAFSYIGVGNTSKVEFRVVNVIDSIDFSKTSNLRVGDSISLSGFGRDLFDEYEFNSWMYNLPTNHNIQVISQVDSTKYRVQLFDKVYFYVGEEILLVDSSNNNTQAKIIDVEYSASDLIKKYANTVLIQVLNPGSFTVLESSILRKRIYKVNHYSNYFQDLGNISAGVQNTYIDSDEKFFYVTSSGLPNYTVFSTDNKKIGITNAGSASTDTFNIPDHNYLSGEVLYYDNTSNSSGLSTGLYYATRVDKNNIKLSYSKSDIFSEKYINVNPGISGDIFYKSGYEGKSLKHQKLLKKFPFKTSKSLFDDLNERTTFNREVGMLINGVEVLSPTLFDENIYYGGLSSIEVTNPGEEYDVIESPPIEVRDETGNSVKAHLNLSGTVREVNILNAGYGYQEKPKVTITGGNGVGCALESNFVSTRVSAGFKADLNVETIGNTIQFLTTIPFEDGEEVIYDSNKNQNLPGIVDSSTYFVGILTDNKIKLFNTQQDALRKENEIDIVGVSSGFHFITTLKNKNTFTKIYVKDPGRGYSNRKVKVPSLLSANNVSGINTFDSYVYARNHGFSNEEYVIYQSSDTPISGLSTSSYYQVKVVDNNRFRLYNAGVSTQLSSENYDKNKFVKFESLGVGTHIFGYPPIEIKVESKSGTGATTIINSELIPIVLGSIDDVYIEDGGIGFGCTNIVNFHRRPDVGVSSITSNAILKPIIIEGSIVDVQIINRGKGFRKNCQILVDGVGNFAQLEPIISDGSIQAVNIVFGGVGYASSNTTLTLKNRGQNAKFLANVTEWKINQIFKSKDVINKDDDGILYSSKNTDLGLQFISFYVPKNLRYQLSDNFTENNKENTGTLNHSPILGYAYDGNPIYGPYAYNTTTGGFIRRMNPGYVLDVDTTSGKRPPSFEGGFFVNDYKYDGSGDLDIHNGRFAITPEYPNGVYAYFSTIDVSASNESTPKYPYVVGPYFYNKPVEENFLPGFNQDFNVFDTTLTRNIGPYYLNRSSSSYDLIETVLEEYKQEFSVTAINSGKIEDVSIFSSGDNYKVNDPVDVDITGSGGVQPNIVVSELDGREVDAFTVVQEKIQNAEFNIRTPNTVIRTSGPHGIDNGQPITITGISTITSSAFEGVQIVEVKNKEVELSEDIADEATTTKFTFIKVKDVNGFQVNDFIGIGTEKLLITKIDFQRSGFHVNRLENTGIHTISGGNVNLLPREFSIPTGNVTDYVIKNYTTFFDPKSDVGIGSTGSFRTVVGFGNSTTEMKLIPPRSIYLPGHKFYTGQPLKYNSGSGFAGTSLYVNNVGVAQSIQLEDDQTVYAVNLGRDFIGLSTVGFTTSSTNGIGTNNNSVEFWDQEDFSGVIGAAHSLTTINPKITATLEKSSGIVTTTSNHNLQVGDEILFNVSTDYNEVVKVFFDPVNRKVLMREVAFSDSDVSLSDSSIDVSSYTGNIVTGDKVLYISAYPINGLENYSTYYVLRTDPNTIKLCKYRSDIEDSNFINFTSIGGVDQKLHFVNPQITCIRTTKIEFDVSDSSLSSLDLQFYFDVNFVEKINERTGFFVEREGIPGDPGAKIILDLSSQFFPIYYGLFTKGTSEQSKNQISTDIDVLSHNKISIVNHRLNSRFKLTSVSDKSFTFFSDKKPTFIENQILTQNLTTFSYKTTSHSALGPISKLKINFPGRGFNKVPRVREVKSERGTNAVVKLISPNIGRVETFTRVKDGFDYPTDPTLSPSLSVPTVLGVKDIRTIDYIGITTGGRRYNSPPKLLVKNNDLDIELGAVISGGSVTNVTINKNSTSIAKPLEVITIFNSNGYEIDNISVVGNSITLELSNVAGLTPFIPTGFGSTDFVYPFNVGDEIFVENCRLTDETRALGRANFNSSSYDYAFFTVTGISSINNTVTYDMTGISTGTFGDYSDEFNLGTVINKNDMPVFEMILKDDVNYASNEVVTSPRFSGRIMERGWDGRLNQMRLKNVSGDITVGDKIYGETSKITGTVEYFDKFNLFATLGVSRDKTASVDLSSGILNEYSQRISDNFYYQKFSYSIKGGVPYDKWRESVRSIVHPSGFKEFSDLEIVTSPTQNEVNVGIARSVNMKPKLAVSDSFTFLNVDEVISMSVRKNFARVYEEELLENGSTQNVYFDEGVDLEAYIMNRTNKVLNIDDISDQFNGTSEQYLRGRYADASDLLDLNREFIKEEVVAFVEFNYPNIGLSTTYSKEKCLRDTGFIVDAVSHDLKYNSNNKSVEAGLAYWDAGSSYVTNETEETLFAYNYVKFIGQYVINNQTPPTLYQSSVQQQFNFTVTPDPLNNNVNRYKDSRDLILANKREIQDRSLASVAIGFPDFYFPGDNQTNERSRYYDGYRLIQVNRQEIIDTSYSNSLSVYPGLSTVTSQYKSDLGKFIDAVSVDIFTGGNAYSREFTASYFNNDIIIPGSLTGGQSESLYGFVQSRDLMRSAVRNGLSIQDLTVTDGPPTYGVGTTVSNTDSNACSDVQFNIVSLVGVITSIISLGSTATLPVLNVGTYTTGGNKCFRDLGYIIDGVAQDLSYGTNQHTIYNTKKYFDGVGVALTNGLLGEESESIYVFESSRGYMKDAVTNQLYSKDLTITADPLTGFNTDPSSCADVQTNIDTLVGILTVAIGNSSLAGIPTEFYGTADCADVRSSLGNYVGIITTIIGLGTNFAPDLTFPSLTRGGAVVGLTTFKLKNKGISLFKHEFTSSSIDVTTDTFTIPNHNFQSGQELIYSYSNGSPIGIATTSYVSGPVDSLLNVYDFDGTSVLENGYAGALTTSITGVSTVLSPVGPSFKQYVQTVGNGTTGTGAEFNVTITYSVSTGQPLSTSITLIKGGSGYSIGETVSIAGTYMGGTTPTNDLSFVVSATGPTVLDAEANQSYSEVPSSDATGATFNVFRNNDGEIASVDVLNGGSGYDSNSVISIAGTYIGGSGSNDDLSFRPLELGTDSLPANLFVFKLNDNQFKLSGLSTSVFLNLTGVGTATHSLEYKDPNASVMITIDGVIQKPLSRKSLEVVLASSVSTASTDILSIASGISSLNVRDIINLDNELVSIKKIGVSSENHVEVERGYFGTVAAAHTIGAAATVLNGSFNIIGDIIYFDTAPYGQIGPVGLETGSIFGGRAFSRRFDAGTPEDKNILFDDISLSFTGIAATEFTLKSNNQTTNTVFNDVNNSTEISNNPIVLINNVFQNPSVDYTVDGSGTNVLRFLSGTPNAGRISKVSISTSFGYIPLIGAAATVVVSAAGTISDVVVTGGGSGYRSAPVVSIASTIGTGASITATVGAGGTITGYTVVNAGSGYTTTSLPVAAIGLPTGYSALSLDYADGSSGVGQDARLSVQIGMGSSVINFKFDRPGLGYKLGDKLTPVGIYTNTSIRYDSLNISNVLYNNTTGLTTITTDSVHNLSEDDLVTLTGIAFTCGYDEVGIQTFSYDEASGICTVVTYSPHGLLRDDVPANQTSDEVFLFNLPFSCAAEHAGVTTTIFPDGTSSYGRVFPVLTSISSTTFTMNAGVSTIPHIFEGWSEIGITTFSYYEVTGLSTVTTSTNHEFAVGDKVTLAGLAFTCDSQYVGLTTTIFPDGTSEYGYTFTVTAVNSATEFEFLAGISTIVHYYTGGGHTKKVPTVQRVLRYTDDSTDGARDFRVVSIGSTNEFTVLAGSISTIPHYYTQGGIVTFKQYEPFILTVEEVQTDTFAGFYPGQFIQFDDISTFFNGFRKKFTLATTLNGVRTVIGLKVPDGTDLDITNNIFIYINDVLQVPGTSYSFSGSRITFTEAPKAGSKCVILYYRGSSVDVELIDPPKTIKPGDNIVIQENPLDPYDISQFDRVVKKIVTSDQLETFNYYSVGIITDPTRVRPLTWKKQLSDTVISGTLYSKSRPSLQSGVKPFATVIKKILPDDTSIYVDNAYPLFTDIDKLSEDIRDILILENKTVEQCLTETVVATSSTVSTINITNGGVGYANTLSPKVIISESSINQKDPIFNWKGSTGLTTTYSLNSLKFNDRFVAVGANAVYATSYDGIDWQIGTVGFGQTQSIDFNSIESVGIGTSNLLVSVGSLGKIVKATDYNTSTSVWEQIPLKEDVALPGFGVINQVGSGYTGTFNQIVYSSVTDSWVAVGAAGSIFVATGVTTDAFINRFSSTLSDLNSVAFGAEYFVAVGADGVIRTSNNGAIWENASSPVSTNLNKVIYADGRFVAVGNNGKVLRNLTRDTYEIIANNLGTLDITNVYYSYGFYVATVSNGDVYYSFDLSDWIYRSTNQSNYINDFVFEDSLGSDGRYVIVGVGATAMYAEPVLNRATAISSVTNGVVTSIEVDNPGFGYDPNNPPPAIVELDTYKTETVKSFKVVGDFGIIIGIQTYISGTPGIGTTSPKISFTLKSEQYDNSTLGIGYSSLNVLGVTNSQLSKGDYFVITDSNVETGGNLIGISTLLGGMSSYPDSVVGVATQFLDGVYRVEDVTTPSIGIVTVTCNFAPMIDNYVQVWPRGENDTGVNTGGFYGRYSWAKIYDYQNRILGDPQTFDVFIDNGITGLSTSPKVLRTRTVVSQ